MTDLTDEQLGRKWCERHNCVPDYAPRRGVASWRWLCDDGPPSALPAVLWDCLPRKRYQTSDNAYAAVGSALRELKRRADEIAAVQPVEVPT